MKKLWLISQDENQGYDTFDCAVVCAESEQEAKEMDPNSRTGEKYKFGKPFADWASSPENVTARFIGFADDDVQVGVVCASFNAG